MPKRRFQEGCIRIVGKQWVLYYWMDVNQDGVIRRVKRSARLGAAKISSRAARAAAQPILDAVNHQTDAPVVASRGLTLTDFVTEWRQKAANSYKPSTLRGMESSIRQFLPVLGHLSLTGIGALQVQNLVTTMKGRKRRTCLNLVVDLFSILRVARSWNYQVPIIKLESVRLPVDDQDNEQAFFTPAEVRSILAYFEGRRPWDTFFLLLACTGLRASEILGLRVCDLDFSRRQIHIRQSCWHGKIQTLKTKGSKKPIPMTSRADNFAPSARCSRNTAQGSPWRENGDRLRVICREKNPGLGASGHRVAIARDGNQTCGGRGWSDSPGYKNTSSTFFPKTRAILKASGRLGSYFPVSIALMVPRATPTWAASSACDHSFSARNTRSRVFIDTATNKESIRCSTK